MRDGKVKAIFIRHPESTGNREKLVKGTKDYPLDAKGKKESKYLATRIARYKPTVVISSPLSRAKEPAKAIAKVAGVSAKVDRELLPQNFGDITGEKRSTGEPKIRKFAMEHPARKIPGGESFNGWDAKNTSAMRRIKVLIAKGERPAVVTHSRNLRELKHAMFGAKKADPTRGGPEPSGFMTLTGKRKLVIHKGAS